MNRSLQNLHFAYRLLLISVCWLLGMQENRSQLVTNGLLGEWRFDEGSQATVRQPGVYYQFNQTVLNQGAIYTCVQAGTSSSDEIGPIGTGNNIPDGSARFSYYGLIKGYDSSGQHNQLLDSQTPISYPGLWTQAGYKANPPTVVKLANGQGVMTNAMTVFVVADISRPSNVLSGSPGLVGNGGYPYYPNSGFKEQFIDGGGRPSLGGSTDTGWYISDQLGTIPLLRPQGVIAAAFVYGQANAYNTLVYYNGTPQNYYLSRGAPKTTGAQGDYAALMYDGFSGFTGTIYYLAIYNRALSASEVSQNTSYVQGVLAKRTSSITVGDTIPTTQPLMVFEGDSITNGYGSTNGINGWAHEVARSLNGSYRDINAGLPLVSVCPDASGNNGYYNFGPAEVDPLLTRSKSGYGNPSKNIAVIFLGANDLASGTSAAEIEQYLMDRVQKVKAAGAAQVVLCTLLPRYNCSETTRTQLNQYILAHEQTGGYVVSDFGGDPIMGNYSNVQQTATLWYSDDVHPTQLGHDVLSLLLDATLADIGVDANTLSFSNHDPGVVAGTSAGYETYYSLNANWEATDCYNPSRKVQDRPAGDTYLSVQMTHLGPLCLGLHTDLKTDTGVGFSSKPQVAYYLANAGTGAYLVGGSAGGWGSVTNLTPKSNDILRLRRTPVTLGDTGSILYAEVSQDGGHFWTTISSISSTTHGTLPPGDLFPRLMSNDPDMTPTILKCNGAVATMGPDWLAPPTISAPQVGEYTTVTTNTTGGPDTYTFQWNLDGVPISGATASYYIPTSADVGHTLTVTVAATNLSGSSSSTSLVSPFDVVTVPQDTPLPAWAGSILALALIWVALRKRHHLRDNSLTPKA